MKYLHFSLLYCFLLAVTSCDKIKDNRLEKITDNTPTDTTDKYIVYPDTGFQTEKKVLVEDYTGHTCGNCPLAAQQLDQIIAAKGDRIVPLALHVGSFAEPQPADGYPDDFRTAEGTAMDVFFGISAFGLPQGMVDRTGFPAQLHITPFTGWLSKVNTRLALSPQVFLALKNEVTQSGKTLRVTVKSNFVSALTGNYKLSVLLAEDSVIASQKFYGNTPEHITDYKHKHMLRAALNSAWGESIADNPSAGSTGTLKTYVQNLATNWNKNKLYVIAFVYKADTYEVVQAEARKIN
jgi:hypothetical protein